MGTVARTAITTDLRIAALETQLTQQAEVIGELRAAVAVQTLITRRLMETGGVLSPAAAPQRPRHLAGGAS